MNIIKSGNEVKVYDNEVQVSKSLEAGVYKVRFSPNSGYSLECANNIENKDEKVYGEINSKVIKTLKSFEISNRNLGVILSGYKGTGKSLFSKILCNNAMHRGIPIIIVEANTPELPSFIEKINQEVVIMIDEFEKIFRGGQDSMLSLIDGMGCGKKLFVITCNDREKLSEFLINRTGRFHYNFTFEFPTPLEVKQYCLDKLGEGFEDSINKIAIFSSKIRISFDTLRSICFEIKQGYSFEETIQDLNIFKGEEGYIFNVKVEKCNGRLLEALERIDLFEKRIRVSFFDPDRAGSDNNVKNLARNSQECYLEVNLFTEKLSQNIETGELYIHFTEEEKIDTGVSKVTLTRVESWHGSKFNENQKENKDCLSYAKFEL